MCGIAGFYCLEKDFTKDRPQWEEILHQMNKTQKKRGPDEDGSCLTPHCGLAHVRLNIIDPATGQQPMSHREGSRQCTIVFNGEIYNMQELKEELAAEGAVFQTKSDTEVILLGFMLHGKDYVKKLNGIFAIALFDSHSRTLFLFRDRLGVKPLFYTRLGDILIFASEIKGLLSFPGVRPRLDTDGLCEILALGPARSYGNGVFKDIQEVLPGHSLISSPGSLTQEAYWRLEGRPHEDSFEQTVEKTAWLIEDAVKKQMLSDVPISTFLSGGLDSSLITSICAGELKKQGKPLNTFSFDFIDNHRYFRANSFQPSEDRPFVEEMVAFCGSNHRFLECSNRQQLEYLYKAVDARDLPGMADVESSMLYFCSQVAPHNRVTLTGECADEIFGGYPWFHQKEAFETSSFPWSKSMKPRQVLLADDLIQSLPMEEYARKAYEKTIGETPLLSEDSPEEKRRREIAWLNLRWFMATLLDRMDRTSMYNGLEARVPLADHRIVEYVFNVPWRMKAADGVAKGLLRHAAKGKLPPKVLWRKKSPYPKTYDPAYEQLLGLELKEVLSSPSAPVRALLDTRKVHRFLESPSDYGQPWYGQLMAGPQLLAYFLQINYWLEKYKIELI